jgi:hypothetical protein
MSKASLIIRVEKGPQGRARGSTGLFAGWTAEECKELWELLTGEPNMVEMEPSTWAVILDEHLSKGQPPYQPPRSSPKMRLLARLRAL